MHPAPTHFDKPRIRKHCFFTLCSYLYSGGLAPWSPRRNRIRRNSWRHPPAFSFFPQSPKLVHPGDSSSQTIPFLAAMSYLYDPWTSRERANLSEPRADVSSEHMYYHQAGGGAYNYGTPTGEPYSSPPSSYQSTFWPMSPSGEHVQPAHAAQSSSSGSAASDYPYGPYSRSHDDGKLESRTCHCGKVFRRNSDLT